MGSVRRIKNKDGSIRWRAEVYVSGTRDSARFPTKPEAADWILTREAELERRAGIESTRTLADALLRYGDEVSPKKRGERWEKVRLRKFARDPIALVPLLDLNLEDAESFRERGLETISPGSVIRELNLLKSVVRRAVRWRWMPAYPWDGLELPPRPRPRERFITDAEVAAMAKQAKVDAGQPVVNTTQRAGVLFLLGCVSAMRIGEMTSLRWEHFDPVGRVAYLPMTKNGDARRVSLSTESVALIERMPRTGETVFEMTPATASSLIRRIREQAGLSGFTGHDARHRAITLMAERLQPYELCRVAGFRSLGQVMTYYNKSAEDIATKLG